MTEKERYEMYELLKDTIDNTVRHYFYEELRLIYKLYATLIRLSSASTIERFCSKNERGTVYKDEVVTYAEHMANEKETEIRERIKGYELPEKNSPAPAETEKKENAPLQLEDIKSHIDSLFKSLENSIKFATVQEKSGKPENPETESIIENIMEKFSGSITGKLDDIYNKLDSLNNREPAAVDPDRIAGTISKKLNQTMSSEDEIAKVISEEVTKSVCDTLKTIIPAETKLEEKNSGADELTDQINQLKSLIVSLKAYINANKEHKTPESQPETKENIESIDSLKLEENGSSDQKDFAFVDKDTMRTEYHTPLIVSGNLDPSDDDVQGVAGLQDKRDTNEDPFMRENG